MPKGNRGDQDDALAEDPPPLSGDGQVILKDACMFPINPTARSLAMGEPPVQRKFVATTFHKWRLYQTNGKNTHTHLDMAANAAIPNTGSMAISMSEARIVYNVWHVANPSTGYLRFGNQYSVATGIRDFSQTEISQANRKAALLLRPDKPPVLKRGQGNCQLRQKKRRPIRCPCCQ